MCGLVSQVNVYFLLLACANFYFNNIFLQNVDTQTIYRVIYVKVKKQN